MRGFLVASKVPLIILLIFSILVIFISIYLPEIPGFKVWGIYNNKAFWESFFLNLNSSIVEIFIFSVVLVYIVNKSSEKARKETEVRINKEWFDINRGQNGYPIIIMNVLALKKLLNLNTNNLNLSKIYFSETTLTNVSIIKSKFMGAIFFGSRIKDCNFNACDFKGAVFSSATLSKVEFIKCSLRNSKFQQAVAKGVVFKECDLYKTDFSQGNFKNADLRNTDLLHVIFEDANFSHANFKGARNLDLDSLLKAKSLNKIKIDKKTYDCLKEKYPEKFIAN